VRATPQFSALYNFYLAAIGGVVTCWTVGYKKEELVVKHTAYGKVLSAAKQSLVEPQLYWAQPGPG